MSTGTGRAAPPLPEQCAHDRFTERADDAE